MAEHPNAPRCHHVHTSGLRCGSPAMRNQKPCYYHKQTTGARPFPRASLPNFEDGPALQLAIAQLARSVFQGGIDYRAAHILTNIYRLALRNLKNMNQYVANPDDQVIFDPGLEDPDFQNSVASSPESHITEPITHEQEQDMIEAGTLPSRSTVVQTPPVCAPPNPSGFEGLCGNDPGDPYEIASHQFPSVERDAVAQPAAALGKRETGNGKPASSEKRETRNWRRLEDLTEKEREAEIMRMCGNKAYFMKEEDMPPAPPPPDWEDIKAEIRKVLAG